MADKKDKDWSAETARMQSYTEILKSGEIRKTDDTIKVRLWGRGRETQLEWRACAGCAWCRGKWSLSENLMCC